MNEATRSLLWCTGAILAGVIMMLSGLYFLIELLVVLGIGFMGGGGFTILLLASQELAEEPERK